LVGNVNNWLEILPLGADFVVTQDIANPNRNKNNDKKLENAEFNLCSHQ
jgi:hypothetical protein